GLRRGEGGRRLARSLDPDGARRPARAPRRPAGAARAGPARLPRRVRRRRRCGLRDRRGGDRPPRDRRAGEPRPGDGQREGAGRGRPSAATRGGPGGLRAPLADQPELLEPGLRVYRDESGAAAGVAFGTGVGEIDLLATDGRGNLVAVMVAEKGRGEEDLVAE